MTPFEKFMTGLGPLGIGILYNIQDVNDIIKVDFEHLAYALGQRAGMATEIAVTAGIGKLAGVTSVVKTGSKVVPKVGSGGKVLQFKGSSAKLAESKIKITKLTAPKIAGNKISGKGTGGGNSAKNPDSQLQKVFDVADDYNMSDDVYNNHIVDRHSSGGSSYSNKSKFNADYDIKGGIDDALKSPDSIVKPNTAGRDGYIFEHTYDNPIGVNPKGKPLDIIKVVIDESGNVVTAFPKK